MTWPDAASPRPSATTTPRKIQGVRPRTFSERLFDRVLFPLWEAGVRRRPTVALHDELERTQWRSRGELVELQRRALQALLRHAYAHVPFYRTRFEQAGITPDDVHDARDLARLPLLTREEVRNSVEARTSRVPPFPTIFKTTSGSAGAPIPVAYEPGSEHWRQAVKIRSYAWAGLHPGTRTIHYWGPPLHPPPRFQAMKIALDRRLRQELYLDCCSQSEEALGRVVETIRRFRPRCIVSYAQAAGTLARFVVDRGLRDWDVIPVICTAEQLLASDRDVIEQAFGPGAVFNSYGGRETMLLAQECERHDGLHVPVENILLEIVVREVERGELRERPARPGEVGEVAVTDLHNWSRPFIRYLNGDLAQQADDRPCACGRGLPRIASVEGRQVDVLQDGAGGKVQGMVFPVLMLPYAQFVRQYQAIQHKDRSIDVLLVPAGGLDARIETELQQKLASIVRGVPIRLQRVPEIAASASGKRRPVIIEQ
jgi:phenylacetate-CoA ligase